MSMIKSFFTRETKTSEPAPLIDLLIYRSTFQFVSLDTPEGRLFEEIPLIDKGVLQKCKVDTNLLPKLKPLFKRNNLKEIINLTANSAPSEILCCVILYNCLCWYYGASDRQIDDFIMVIKVLNLIHKCSSTVSSIRNIIYTQYVKLATSPPPRLKITEDVYRQLVMHLNKNSSIDSSIFSLLIQLFRQVMNSGKEGFIDEMYDVIINLLNVNPSFFDFNNISSFMPILNLSALKMRSLNILAKLSTKSDITVIRDAYRQLPQTMNNIILKYEPAIEYVSKTDTDSDKKIEYISPIIEENENDDFEFSGNFKPLSYAILSDKYEIVQLIAERFQNTLFEMSGSLSNSSKSAQKTFAERSFQLINKLKGTKDFYQIVASFFHIFQKIIDVELLKAMIPQICTSLIFSSEYNVFDKLPKCMSTLRNFLFSLIESVHPPHIVILINNLSKNPLMLAECFFRIMNNFKSYPIGLFTSKEMIKIITETGINLQSLESTHKVITSARNVYFQFINKIINTPQYAYLLLKSRTFCNNFLCYYKEPKMARYIMETIQNTISLVPPNCSLKNCSSYFRNIVEEGVKSDQESEIIEQLSENISKSISFNPSIAYNFSILFEPFLNYTEKHKNAKVLNSMLYLLMLSSFDSTFSLDITLYKKFSKCIKLIHGSEPTRTVEWQLFSTLSKTVTDFPLFIIKAPTIIPLILTVFSSSSRLIPILTKFRKLCEYSEVNKKACHEGDLVFILSQLWLSNHVHYSNYEFEFQISEKERDEVVYPLIECISLSYSGSIVNDFYVNNLENQSLLNLVMKMIPQCETVLIPQFPLGIMPTQFTVKGIYPEDLKDGFTAHMMLNLDLNSIDDPGKHIEIFRLTDSNGSFLSVFVSDSMILTKYESSGLRTTVALAKMPPANIYTDFTFIYKINENRIRISCFQNLSPLNDSDFVYFEFASGELTLSVGGYYENYKTIYQYGILKNFALFPTTTINNTDAVKRLYSIESQALFSSNWIKEPSISHDFTVKRSINKSIKNCPSHIVVSVNDSIKSPSNLLTTIITSSYSNKIAEKFFVDGILGTLKLLFQNSKNVQLEFESSKFIHLYLMKHPKLITSFIYFEIYDLFTEITDKLLQADWFEHLIINVWLWSQSSFTDLIEILTHWGKTLVYSHCSLFKQKSYFSQLLTQFRLFFCYEDDCVKPFNVTHFDQSVEEDKNDKARKLSVWRDLFLIFLSKVSYLYMNMSDVKEFFGHLMSNPVKSSTIYLLQLLYSFCNRNVDTTNYFPNLLSLLCNDNEINECVFLAIHYMFDGQLNSFQPMIVAFEKLKSIGRPKQEDSLLTTELFNNLCKRLHSFPNLMPVLCLFALEIHKEVELGQIFIEEKETISPSIVNNEYWYIWPSLLGFNTPDDNLQNISQFLVYSLTLSETVLQDIPYTVIFINLLMFATKESKFIQVFIDGFLSVRDANQDIIKAAVEVCFYSCFFHFSGKSFHDFVLDEFRNQQIDFKYTGKDHTGFMESIRDMDDIHKLAKMSYTAIDLHFEFRIDLLKKWKDLSFASTAMRLLSTSTYSNEIFVLVFQYFTDPRLIQPESQLINLQYQLEPIIQEQFEKYNTLVKSCFSSLITRFFPNFFVFINNTTSASKQVAAKPKKEREEVAIEKMKDEIDRSSNLNITIMRQNFLKPDLTCCLLFTPMKRRRRKVIKSSFSVQNILLDDPYFEINCKRISISGNDKNSVFRCSPKYIVIGEKVFPSNQLSLILSRKRHGRENSIELFMRSGETFLLDFSPNDNNNIFKSLLKCNYPNAVIQKGSNYSFFSSNCNYTENWEKGMIPNFDYLLLLNAFAGRSYNDLTLCPIVPLLVDNDDKNKLLNISNNKAKVVMPDFYLLRSRKDLDIPGKPKKLEVPEEDKDYFEFIYGLRKLLEGKQVSNMLPAFIDNFFGCRIASNWPSFSIFRKSHPQRTQFKPSNSHSKIKEHRLKLSILYSKFIKTENSVYYAIVINKNPSLNISNGLEYKTIKIDASNVYNVEIASNQEIEGNEKNTTFAGFLRKVYLINENSSIMTTFIEKVKSETAFFPYKTKFIISCENDLIFCPDDATINVKSFINKTTTTIWKSNSKITNITANSDFKVFAFSTIDNFVSVHSLNNGCEVNQIDVVNDVDYMIFTRKWSFLCIFSFSTISILNVDGEVLKICPDFNEKVIFADSFTSINGFDYIIYQNDRYQVFFFEAFYPDKRKLIVGANSELRSSWHDRMASCIIFIYANGLVQLQPFSLVE